jgi:hypothetical protein
MPEPGTLNLHPKCLLTELDDGTGVVLNLETKFYHTLNSAAVTLWKALERGARTDAELAGRLVSEFEVDEAQALADVAVALLEFERDGLLVRRDARSRARRSTACKRPDGRRKHAKISLNRSPF